MALLRGCLAALLFLASAAAAQAEDPALSRLHTLIAPLRRAPPVPGVDSRGPWNYQAPGTDWRGATPVLNEAKHTLRDWIEAKLANAPRNVRERALVAQLNGALARADLFCQRVEREAAPNPCSTGPWDWDPSGFLFPRIRIERPTPGVLLVYSGFGIVCGTDMSAYGYEWRAGRWQRFWQYEQPIAAGADYQPQSLDSVLVSKADTSSGARMVLMLGNMDWCSSTYYPVYVRLWRATSGAGEPKLLLNLTERAWLGGDLVIDGHASLTQAQFEFMRPGLEVAGGRQAIVRFAVQGDTLTRVDPLAYDPIAFVEEWVHAPWPESRRWVAAPNAATLEPWHKTLSADDVYTDSMTTNGCRKDPSLWQVTLPLSRRDESVETLYLLVSRPSPERFEVRDIGVMPRADCDGPEFGAAQ